MLRYGWPLLLSFGVLAIGQSIDRLLLAHLSGTSALGPYGVVADLLRQSFSVVGEAVILACGVVAKQHANDGNIEAANRELRKAFNACLATAVFGALFFFVFGDFVLSILLGRQFVEPSRDLVPVLAVGFAFVTMRNFYFAQVIYFSRSRLFRANDVHLVRDRFHDASGLVDSVPWRVWRRSRLDGFFLYLLHGLSCGWTALLSSPYRSRRCWHDSRARVRVRRGRVVNRLGWCSCRRRFVHESRSICHPGGAIGDPLRPLSRKQRRHINRRRTCHSGQLKTG